MRLVSRVKTIEELHEVRGALTVLRALETLPSHVDMKLEEFEVADQQEERSHARRR